jgi:hypothetical protein
MPTSAARILANQANAQRSIGPKTAEGKAASRRNGLKHGLSGQGVVLDPEALDEVAARSESLHDELGPKSVLGRILVDQLAVLSVKLERAAKQEAASLAVRVRHASADFDDERFDQAERLFESLADDPRRSLRELKKSPEGVDRLIEAWAEVRATLSRKIRPTCNLEKIAHLLGLPTGSLSGTRLDALTQATWGNFNHLDESERTSLDPEARKAWACAQLIERIDGEIDQLKALRETFDFEGIDRDRAGAGDRALFDPSREASLARRYESEARRCFFKTLNELREVEAQFAEASNEKSAAPEAPEAPAALGSSRESRVPTAREPEPGSRSVPRVAARAPKRAKSVDFQVDRRAQEVGRPVVSVS